MNYKEHIASLQADRRNALTKQEALEDIAEFILDNERDNYLEYCLENNLEHSNYEGDFQFKHVYAKSMVAFGLDRSYVEVEDVQDECPF